MFVAAPLRYLEVAYSAFAMRRPSTLLFFREAVVPTPDAASRHAQRCP